MTLDPRIRMWPAEPSVAPEPIPPAPVDVRDMIVVHTALLREYRLTPALIRLVADGDVRRAEIVGAHLHFLDDLLHHHHAGEDDLLWPKLLARVPAELAPLIELMELQHHRIEVALNLVNGALAAWRASADVEIRDRLADQVQELHALLATHLDTEERDLLPLASTCLTAQEWQEIGRSGVSALPKLKVPMVFGMFMYEGAPEVLADMLRTVPALPRLLLPGIARRSYARYARKVHGVPAP
ncbi:hemerythrin-like domain-containing protein [Nakamurella sp. UYEF19]|uniref:hemerythrin domain-containing protein n=1 Tax=Nakamurella sp. UYEF19 TaxID=1756392 RepID=UPI00339A7183